MTYRPVTTSTADIVIVGGGPTGLMLACELRLAGAAPVVLERLPEISEIPKGNGLVGQIVPMLDYRGLLERFSAGATFAGPVPRFSFGPLELDFSRLATSPLHILAIPQRRLEELLGERLRELGGDLPMTDPRLLTRLTANSRLADQYRAGRILLAGDAAHVFGLGGSLNTGLLDAVNLGWKLAAQAQGRAPDGLLDSYHAERHLAGQHAIAHTRAQKALPAIGVNSPGANEPGKVSAEGAAALRELFGDVLEHPKPLGQVRELLRQPGPLHRIGELIEGSDVRYPMPSDSYLMTAGSGQPHPLLGRLMPDLPLETAGGATRIAVLMRAARGVLLDLSPDFAVAAAASGCAGRVSVITARRRAERGPAHLVQPTGVVTIRACSSACSSR